MCLKQSNYFFTHYLKPLSVIKVDHWRNSIITEEWEAEKVAEHNKGN